MATTKNQKPTTKTAATKAVTAKGKSATATKAIEKAKPKVAVKTSAKMKEEPKVIAKPKLATTKVSTKKPKVVEQAKTVKGEKAEILSNGKVRVLHSLSDLAEIVPTIADDTKRFMNTLHAFLRDKVSADNISRKKDVIDCREYRMGFEEEGFIIRDLRNFSKVCEDWNNPFPSPREVWEFLNTAKQKPKMRRYFDHDLGEYVEEEKPSAPKVRETVVLKKGVTGKQYSAPEPEPEPIVEKIDTTSIEYYEGIRKKMLRKVSRESNAHKLIEKLAGALQHRSFNVFYNKLVRKFKAKQIRGAKFISEVKELLTNISFAEKKKPAEKFVKLSPWAISEMVQDGNDLILKINKKEYCCTKSELVARQLLSTMDGIMPQMMKALRGTITYEEFVKNPIERDRFEGFEYGLLVGEYNEELYNACREILDEEQIHCQLDMLHSNECDLQKGDKISVEFIPFNSWFTGIVINLHNGIEIRYEDGEVSNLHKRSTWEKK